MRIATIEHMGISHSQIQETEPAIVQGGHLRVECCASRVISDNNCKPHRVYCFVLRSNGQCKQSFGVRYSATKQAHQQLQQHTFVARFQPRFPTSVMDNFRDMVHDEANVARRGRAMAVYLTQLVQWFVAQPTALTASQTRRIMDTIGFDPTVAILGFDPDDLPGDVFNYAGMEDDEYRWLKRRQSQGHRLQLAAMKEEEHQRFRAHAFWRILQMPVVLHKFSHNQRLLRRQRTDEEVAASYPMLLPRARTPPRQPHDLQLSPSGRTKI